MKRGIALALVMLLALLAGCRKEAQVVIIASAEGLAAAQAIAAQMKAGRTVSAATDRAALQQLIAGQCECAVVTEKQLRDAITGGGEYNGITEESLHRLENVMLSVFATLSTCGDALSWDASTRVLVVGEEEGVAGSIASQILIYSQGVIPRYVTRQEALEALAGGRADVVMGMFLPEDEEAGQAAVRARAQAVALPVGLSLDLPDPSMQTVALPPLYDGMTKVDTVALYGALVTREGVDKAVQGEAARAVNATQLRVAVLPEFAFDHEQET